MSSLIIIFSPILVVLLWGNMYLEAHLLWSQDLCLSCIYADIFRGKECTAKCYYILSNTIPQAFWRRWLGPRWFLSSHTASSIRRSKLLLVVFHIFLDISCRFYMYACKIEQGDAPAGKTFSYVSHCLGKSKPEFIICDLQVEQLFSVENNGTNVETRLVNEHLYRALKGSRFQILDITRVSEFRADAHPSAAGGKRHDDCMHWCLPGLTDTWNDLFIAHLSSVRGRHWTESIRNIFWFEICSLLSQLNRFCMFLNCRVVVQLSENTILTQCRNNMYFK